MIQPAAANEPTGQPSIRRYLPLIAASWLWFFLILLSYYCVKPVRDALSSTYSKHLANMYAYTFVTTLVLLSVYSKVVAKFTRRQFVAIVYQTQAICLVAFYVLFRYSPYAQTLWLVEAFFIWVSVATPFLVTLFWSVMADTFTVQQGKAWFGILAGAGSVGGVVGSVLAFRLSRWIGQHGQSGPHGLLMAALLALEAAQVVAWVVLVMVRQSRHESATDVATNLAPREEEQGTGGSVWTGLTHVLQSPYLLGICVLIACSKFTATFTYNNLQDVLREQMPDANLRTELFSRINLYSQTGSLICQSLLVGWLMKRWSVGATLVLPTLLVFVYFVWLAADPQQSTLVIGQIANQVLGYGLLTPAQHVLFTVVSREDKYKSKAFTDNVVFRGGDSLAGQLCDRMAATGATLSTLARYMLPTIVVWAIVSAAVGRGYQRRAAKD